METDNPQAIETLKHVSSASAFLLNREVAEAFAGLTDRDRALGQCLQSSRSQRDLPPYSLGDLLVKIRDWSRPLAAVPEWALGYCFDQAIGVHSRKDGPFGVGEVRQVWAEMAESTKAQIYSQRIQNKSLTTGLPCQFCNNTGMVYRDIDGAICDWEHRGRGVAVSKCDHSGTD